MMRATNENKHTLNIKLPVVALLGVLLGCGGTPPPSAIPEVVVAAPIPSPGAPSKEASTSKSARVLPGPTITELPASAIRFEGGDGRTKERAIKIVGAKGEREGVSAEYQYLDIVFGKGTWKTNDQALLSLNGKKVDQLDITHLAGGKRSVYFDITDYFGKF